MKKFKNDKERIAFLEDYRNRENGWFLWKHDPILQRIWWRRDLPDGTMLVVEEEKRTISWPDVHTEGMVLHWYIVPDLESCPIFGDCVASRPQALAKIKALEKAGCYDI